MRVLGFWKTSATIFPRSACEERGAAFSSSARSSSAASSSRESSAPVSRCLGKRGKIWHRARRPCTTARGDHAHRPLLEPLPRPRRPRRAARRRGPLRAHARRVGMGRRAAPGVPALVAGAARPRLGRARLPRADEPQPAAVAAAAAGRAPAGHRQVLGRRLQRDPRPRRAARQPTRAGACGCGPSAA